MYAGRFLGRLPTCSDTSARLTGVPEASGRLGSFPCLDGRSYHANFDRNKRQKFFPPGHHHLEGIIRSRLVNYISQPNGEKK